MLKFIEKLRMATSTNIRYVYETDIDKLIEPYMIKKFASEVARR